MSIIEADFENEKELDQWVSENLELFLPGAVYLPGIYVATTSGKRGLPDGFAYDLDAQEWYLLEAELLSHRVWPHIAEQLTRFVVAIQNPETRRIIRDHVYDSIIDRDEVELACEMLETTRERLFQKPFLFTLPPKAFSFK